MDNFFREGNLNRHRRRMDKEEKSLLDSLLIFKMDQFYVREYYDKREEEWSEAYPAYALEYSPETKIKRMK